jgi:hypothetical protein
MHSTPGGSCIEDGSGHPPQRPSRSAFTGQRLSATAASSAWGSKAIGWRTAVDSRCDRTPDAVPHDGTASGGQDTHSLQEQLT